jgi:G3E family GTPase
MLFDGKADRPWLPNETRKNELVFIGRNLDEAALKAGFRNCLIKK